MNIALQILSGVIAIVFGTWLVYSTNSLQGGIVGAIGLLNLIMLIDLSYRVK